MENYKKWSINWEVVPKIAKFIVAGNSKNAYWFEKKPDLIGDHWISEQGQHGQLIGKYSGDWKESLTAVNVWTDDWLDECDQKLPQSFNVRAMDKDGECYAFNTNSNEIGLDYDVWDFCHEATNYIGKNKFIGSWQNSKEKRRK